MTTLRQTISLTGSLSMVLGHGLTKISYLLHRIIDSFRGHKKIGVNSIIVISIFVQSCL